jgi:hypothetical protein
MIVGSITAREHRGRVHVPMTANTGTAVYIDLDADAAVEFLEGATGGSPGFWGPEASYLDSSDTPQGTTM